MKKSCPECDWMNLGFPELVEAGVDYNRRCPQCNRIFKRDDKGKLLEIVDASEIPKEDDGDPSNPGNYLTKECSKCGDRVYMSEFWKDKSRPDGLHPHCKKCHNEYQSNYYFRKKNDVIYNIAKAFDLSPAIVRGIIAMYKE